MLVLPERDQAGVVATLHRPGVVQRAMAGQDPRAGGRLLAARAQDVLVGDRDPLQPRATVVIESGCGLDRCIGPRPHIGVQLAVSHLDRVEVGGHQLTAGDLARIQQGDAALDGQPQSVDCRGHARRHPKRALLRFGGVAQHLVQRPRRPHPVGSGDVCQIERVRGRLDAVEIQPRQRRDVSRGCSKAARSRDRPRPRSATAAPRRRRAERLHGRLTRRQNSRAAAERDQERISWSRSESFLVRARRARRWPVSPCRLR